MNKEQGEKRFPIRDQIDRAIKRHFMKTGKYPKTIILGEKLMESFAEENDRTFLSFIIYKGIRITTKLWAK